MRGASCLTAFHDRDICVEAALHDNCDIWAILWDVNIFRFDMFQDPLTSSRFIEFSEGEIAPYVHYASKPPPASLHEVRWPCIATT